MLICFKSLPMVSSIESDNVRRAALVEDPQLSDNLFLDGRLHLQMNHLLSHDHAGRFVTNTVNNA